MPKKQTAKARDAHAAAREGEKVTTTWRRLSSAEVCAGDGQDRLELEFGGEIFQ